MYFSCFSIFRIVQLCSSGDVPESINNEPASALYHFIRITYGIPHSLPEPDDLPIVGNAVLESFVFRKDTEKIVSIAKLPAGYTDLYGKPEVVGCKYTFDWDALMKSSEGERLQGQCAFAFASLADARARADYAVLPREEQKHSPPI